MFRPTAPCGHPPASAATGWSLQPFHAECRLLCLRAGREAVPRKGTAGKGPLVFMSRLETPLWSPLGHQTTRPTSTYQPLSLRLVAVFPRVRGWCVLLLGFLGPPKPFRSQQVLGSLAEAPGFPRTFLRPTAINRSDGGSRPRHKPLPEPNWRGWLRLPTSGHQCRWQRRDSAGWWTRPSGCR